jgi:hypothetical protein
MPQDAPPPEASQPLLEIVRDLPLEVHVAAMIGLGAGLALWLVGRRLIKVVFVLLGIAIGGALGFVIAPLTGYETFEGIDVTHIGLGAGAVAGIIAASFLFRFTIAVSTSAVMAVAGLLGASVYLAAVDAGEPPGELPASELALDGVPFEDETAVPGAQPDEGLPSRPFGFDPDEPPAEQEAEDSPGDSGQRGEDVGEIVDTAGERVREFMIRLGDEARELWASQPAYDRSVMTLAALVSAALGAMIGLVVPTGASAVITSLAGAAIWIPCGLWLANKFDLPGVEHVQGISPKNWLIIWGIIALVGATAQWSGFSTRRFGRRRRRDDGEDDEDEDDDV